MSTRAMLRVGQSCILLTVAGYLAGCRGLVLSNPVALKPANSSQAVLMWKGDPSEIGLYSNEVTLTPANVNVNQFGRIGTLQTDGMLLAQPLFVPQLSIGGVTYDVVIVATEHDSVYAFDLNSPSGGSLWERHYVNPSAGITTMPDNFGGRTTLGPEAGITGTPYIDRSTNVMYFVTTLLNNGTPQQWLRAIDITTGNDFGPGSMLIQASVPGTGVASVNGQITFNAGFENQRPGLTEADGAILVGWGSFSDVGVYHGWLMAFDPTTLNLVAAFNSATQYQAQDSADGPSDHGGGAGYWAGGAAPAVDANGYIYVNGANGSFDAEQGGYNYGDTMTKLRLKGNKFELVDWFTPSNANCIDVENLELGSGGVALLPPDFTEGASLAVATSKEGRLFLVNTNNLGRYDANGDTQIPQEFLVGESSCNINTTDDDAEGPTWNRLYGNPSYWSGNIYAGPANSPLKQYQFEGGLLNPVPVAVSPESYGYRGGNSVVSSNGAQNGIVWVNEKQASGLGVLYAYDAGNISQELWNSNMNAGRDQLGDGIGFGVPVVANGHVLVGTNTSVAIFALLN